jgi:Flp pilus assembly pilin Flp
MSIIKNNKGQSLVEYLIIVALIAVATIGMVQAVGANVSIHFANISKALAGDSSNKVDPIKVNLNKQDATRTLGNYMQGAKLDGQGK